jgi:hypothetical protein
MVGRDLKLVASKLPEVGMKAENDSQQRTSRFWRCSDGGVRGRENRLKILFDRLADWLVWGSKHHLGKISSSDFGFFVRDKLPC